MNWEVLCGEFALLAFLFLSGQPWVLIPALLLLAAEFLPRALWKPLAVLLVAAGASFFFSAYASGPYLAGGVFLSYLLTSEYLWRGRGPWRDWIVLSSLLLVSNTALLARGPVFLFLAVAFVALCLLRMYSRLYPRERFLWGFLAVHLAAVFLLAPLVFILTPRKGFIGLKSGVVSGPSPSVDLNFSGEIFPSSEIFMEIKGKEIPTYWKGRVYYIYKNGRWVNPFRGRAKTGRGILEINPRRTLTVRLYSDESLVLPIPTGGWSVILERNGYWSFRHFIEFTKPVPVYRVFPTPGRTMVLRPHGNGRFIILGREDPAAKARSRILLPPEAVSRIRRLAETLRGETLGESLRKIKDYLNENYEYSLKVEKQGKDPLEGFLFVTRRGHCELFATAAAALLYAMGWDVRLVSGFRITEKGEGWALVRMMDAHAWVQVWDGKGWLNYDPSPVLPRRGKLLPFRGLGARVQLLWERYISGFSYRQQIKTFLWIKENLPWIVLVALMITVGLRMVRLSLFLPREDKKNRVKERENSTKRPWYYRRMLKLLPVKKPPWQTPREFSVLLGKEAQLITMFYYRERFGKIPPNPQEEKKIKEALKKIENRFKRSKGKD